MRGRRDPVEEATDGAVDLYGVATWEPRTRLDRLSAWIYGTVLRLIRTAVVLVAVVILAAQFLLTGLAAVTQPAVGAFTLLSVVPALGIASYVWWADVSVREPLPALVGTFLLGVLFAGFAAILNSLSGPLFAGVPLVGMVLFFYLVVAPVEELVKLLAVRLYAFRSASFDAVIDGAVYGAVAGLGFATIENALYIGQQYTAAAGADVGPPVVTAVVGTAAARTFAGPGHVIYSAFAGYYLGLAKFNREQAGPIVVKGLLVAVLLHATYNTLVGIVPGLTHALAPAIPPAGAFIGFVLVYDGAAGYLLYRKIARYRAAYATAGVRGEWSRTADRDHGDAPIGVGAPEEGASNIDTAVPWDGPFVPGGADEAGGEGDENDGAGDRSGDGAP